MSFAITANDIHAGIDVHHNSRRRGARRRGARRWRCLPAASSRAGSIGSATHLRCNAWTAHRGRRRAFLFFAFGFHLLNVRLDIVATHGTVAFLLQ